MCGRRAISGCSCPCRRDDHCDHGAGGDGGGGAGQHRGVAAQLQFECKISRQFLILQLQALSSSRCQHGFHRFNMHRLTEAGVIRLYVIIAFTATRVQGPLSHALLSEYTPYTTPLHPLGPLYTPYTLPIHPL